MSGLTNKYVERLGNQYLKTFVGVYPCDIQPNVGEGEIFSIIFNESKHNEEGTHFVAIYANKRYLYYFDSLGLKLENKYIEMFCGLQGRQLIESKKQVQSFDSLFCGYFCISFLMFMEKIGYFSRFFECFSKTDLNINNKIAVELIINLAKCE